MSNTKGIIKKSHLEQIDILRIMPMIGVVLVHTVAYTQPMQGVAANAFLMFLHTNRYVFFFITAFVLFYSTDSGNNIGNVWKFWKKRFPFVLLPFVAWTIIYWQLNKFFPWGWYPDSFGAALVQLGQYLVTGWYHLYFLLVTMQFYVLFPLLAWLLRKGKRWAGVILAVSVGMQLAGTGIMQYGWSIIPGILQGVLSYAQVEIFSYQFYFVAGALAAIYLNRYVEWVRENLREVGLISVALTIFGGSWYLFNLNIGEVPFQAAGVFQPAMIAVWLGIVGCLWVLGEGLMKLHDKRLLRWSKSITELSFGIYLVHMIPLQILMLPTVSGSIGLASLPSVVLTIVTAILTIGLAVGLVMIFRLTPFSHVLTGRPQYSFAPLQWNAILRSSGMIFATLRQNRD